MRVAGCPGTLAYHELLKHAAGLQVRADDLALQNRNLREALTRAERMGVIEGLFDLEECGYWKPTEEELAQLRKDYPGRFDEDMEDEDAPDNVA